MKVRTVLSSVLLDTRYISAAEKSSVGFFLEREKCRLSYPGGVGTLIERQVYPVDLLLTHTIISCMFF